MVSAVPLIGALLVQNAIVMINYGFASRYGGEGAIATLGYAERLANVLFSVLVSALFVMLEPKWARELSDSRRSKLPPKIADDVAGTTIACAPLALVLAFAGGDVARLVYGFGALGNVQRLDALGKAAAFFGASVLPMTLSYCFSRVLVILQQTRAVIYVNATLLCACPLLNYCCARSLGTPGIAASFAGLMVLQSVMYAWLLARQNGLSIAINATTVRQMTAVTLSIILVLTLGSHAPLHGFARLALLTALALGAAAVSSLVGNVDWASRILIRVGYHR
jgi:peptidoglycan biosynthesis protein MviN/MurJ (putative lipid II flippase)